MGRFIYPLFPLILGNGSLVLANSEVRLYKEYGSLHPQLAANTVLFDRSEQGDIRMEGTADSFTISGHSGNILSSNNGGEIFAVETNLAVNGDMELNESITSNNNAEWRLISLNTFDNTGGTGGGLWTPSFTSTCGSSDVFLGGPCKLGGKSVSGSYVALPAHKKAKIKARIHFFDEWHGESVYLKVGNSIVWTKSSNWCPKNSGQDCAKHGINVCGHSYPDRLSIPLEVEVTHSGPLMFLTFGSTVNENEDPCRIAWGVDDVAIYFQ